MTGTFTINGFKMASVLLVAVLMVGCVSSRSAEDVSPDEQFGHRVDGEDGEGRATIMINPPDSSKSYFYYPATFEDVIIRAAPFDLTAPIDGQEVAVEALVKGAFPDACTELHEVGQERTGTIITTTLEMRRPQGSICASVQRPYRFYVALEGRYEVGNYTFKLNDRAFPFEVRAPQGQTR